MEQLLSLNSQQVDQTASSAASAAVQGLLNCWAAFWRMVGTANPMLPASDAMPFAQPMLVQVQKGIALLPSDIGSEAAAAAPAQFKVLEGSGSVHAGAGSDGSTINSSSSRDMQAACSDFWDAVAQMEFARDETAIMLRSIEAQDAILCCACASSNQTNAMLSMLSIPFTSFGTSCLAGVLSKSHVVAEAALQRPAACCLILRMELIDTTLKGVTADHHPSTLPLGRQPHEQHAAPRYDSSSIKPPWHAAVPYELGLAHILSNRAALHGRPLLVFWGTVMDSNLSITQPQQAAAAAVAAPKPFAKQLPPKHLAASSPKLQEFQPPTAHHAAEMEQQRQHEQQEQQRQEQLQQQYMPQPGSAAAGAEQQEPFLLKRTSWSRHNTASTQRDGAGDVS